MYILHTFILSWKPLGMVECEIIVFGCVGLFNLPPATTIDRSSKVSYLLSSYHRYHSLVPDFYCSNFRVKCAPGFVLVST